MAVNWRRGLFRLWLVSSTLWVGVVTVSMRPDQQVSTLLASSPTTSSTSASKPDEDTRPPRKWSEMALHDPVKPKTGPENLVAPFDHLDQARGNLVTSTLIAFLPPFAVLALGLVGGWVARGFRG